jgi:hypothetical protein
MEYMFSQGVPQGNSKELGERNIERCREGRKRVPRRRREREERKTGEEEGGKSWVLG